MKGKMLITGVATLSVVALLGCQQQQAAPQQPETKTSTATLEITPPQTQQATSANLEITPASQEGSAANEATEYGSMETSQQEGTPSDTTTSSATSTTSTTTTTTTPTPTLPSGQY